MVERMQGIVIEVIDVVRSYIIDIHHVNLYPIGSQPSHRDTSGMVGIFSYENQCIEGMFLHKLLRGCLHIRLHKEVVEHGGKLYRFFILSRGKHPATSSLTLQEAIEHSDIIGIGKMILYISIQGIGRIKGFFFL